MSDIYEALCAPFESTYTLVKGGAELQYLTLEQVVTRLNQTLGPDGWDFEVKARGQDETHCWALGRLTVYFERRTAVREQMGECGITRGMAVGDSAKGAASDALKKCASLIGVGLYLSHKVEVEQATRALIERTPGEAPAPLERKREASGELSAGCSDCSAPILPWRRKDGTTWSATEVADYARKKFGRVLCWECGRRQAV